MKRLVFLMASLLTVAATAGTFDCSVVYDEFDSLMNKNFIVNPGRYVRTTSNKLSRTDYNSLQKHKFTLTQSRSGYGVVIFRTNRNTYGKLLYTFGAPFSNGNPSLILKDVTTYGRVMDGYRKRVRSRIVVPSSYTVDLDTFAVGAGNNADLWFHNVDGSTMFVEGRNGANLYFPMESMCR